MEDFEILEDIDELDDEELLLLSKWGFNDPEMLPKLRYKYPPRIFIILIYIYISYKWCREIIYIILRIKMGSEIIIIISVDLKKEKKKEYD